MRQRGRTESTKETEGNTAGKKEREKEREERRRGDGGGKSFLQIHHHNTQHITSFLLTYRMSTKFFPNYKHKIRITKKSQCVSITRETIYAHSLLGLGISTVVSR